MRIVAVGSALPPHRYTQARIRERLERLWEGRPGVRRRLATLHENARVRWRHLVWPLERYGPAIGFGERNAAWLEAGLELGQRAAQAALDRAGVDASEVDALYSVSITGVASPSLEACLMNRMPFRSDLKRVPIFGLGCAAGAAGVARAADYLRAYPDQVALLLSVELCSLTFQPEDTSLANAISAGLFGDGAAAVVLMGAERARRTGCGGYDVEATRAAFYRDTEDAMGWRVGERGFEIVLSPSVPTIVRERVAQDVREFLADHGLGCGDVGQWICHPGGPKVLGALQEGLGLPDAAVRPAWEVLEEQGNLSSASVLMVLERALERCVEAPALLLAPGPAFGCELVLLRGRRGRGRAAAEALPGA